MTPIAPIHIHILQKINNFDVLSELKRRIYLFYKVNIILSDFKIFPLYSELPEGTIPYGYAFRTTPDELKKIIPKIAVFGLYPVKWPELPSKVYLTAPEYYKNVYLINFI
jgi:hypothetical protein